MRSLEVSLTFVSEQKMAILNNKYRGKNAPTDVLSFPLWTKKELKKLIHSQANGDNAILLGDIVISPGTALKKAKSGWYTDVIKGKQNRQNVLDFLIEHGVLHLLGHHHK